MVTEAGYWSASVTWGRAVGTVDVKNVVYSGGVYVIFNRNGLLTG